jgi:hypothetical protein
METRNKEINVTIKTKNSYADWLRAETLMQNENSDVLSEIIDRI